MPLQYRPNPIPDHSGLMQLPINAITSRNSTTGNSNFHKRVLRATDAFDDMVVLEVASALVIDMHTHLLPPTHGALCLWGIDELLTYVSDIVHFVMMCQGRATLETNRSSCCARTQLLNDPNSINSITWWLNTLLRHRPM